MFFEPRRIIIALFVTLFALSLAGCGETPPAVETFEAFKQNIQAKNYAAAWSMLTADSQKRLRSENDLKALCEGALSEIFSSDTGNTAEVKAATYTNNNTVSQGDIVVYDKDGKKVGKRGDWKVIDEDGTWKVSWALTTSNSGQAAQSIGN